MRRKQQPAKPQPLLLVGRPPPRVVLEFASQVPVHPAASCTPNSNLNALIQYLFSQYHARQVQGKHLIILFAWANNNILETLCCNMVISFKLPTL